MMGWSPAREVEKPKPLKVRAATAATRLINIRNVIDELVGDVGNPSRCRQALTEAINVLQDVAGKLVDDACAAGGK